MIKPILETKQHLDYNKCIEYVESITGFDVRDYAGAFKGLKKNEGREKPYLDFWQSVLRRFDIRNGSIFIMDVDNWLGDLRAPSWEKEIVAAISDNFRSYKDSDGSLRFWVEW